MVDVKKRVSLIERLEIRIDNSHDTAEQHHTAHVTQDRSSSFSSGMCRDPDVKYKPLLEVPSTQLEKREYETYNRHA